MKIRLFDISQQKAAIVKLTDSFEWKNLRN